MSPSVSLLAVVLFALGANAQDIDLFGKCDPTIDVVRNFTASAFMGRWYEQYKYPAIFEFLGNCITADYSINKDGTVKVVNTQVNQITGSLSNIEGTANFVENPTVGKLSVKFPPAPVAGSYWVLDTDYTSYTLVYSCTQVATAKATIAWILTRERDPSPSLIQKAVTKLREFGLDTSKLKQTKQGKDCLYSAVN